MVVWKAYLLAAGLLTLALLFTVISRDRAPASLSTASEWRSTLQVEVDGEMVPASVLARQWTFAVIGHTIQTGSTTPVTTTTALSQMVSQAVTQAVAWVLVRREAGWLHVSANQSAVSTAAALMVGHAGGWQIVGTAWHLTQADVIDTATTAVLYQEVSTIRHRHDWLSTDTTRAIIAMRSGPTSAWQSVVASVS